MPEHSYAHKSRFEKLSLKPGMRVAVLGFDDGQLAREIEAGLARAPARAARGTFDAIFRLIEKPADLALIERLRARLAPAGALWLVYRKGKTGPVPERAIIEAILAARLVDNKVISFSETHTATRAVIRLKDRPA